jgi:hypothetical protein
MVIGSVKRTRKRSIHVRVSSAMLGAMLRYSILGLLAVVLKRLYEPRLALHAFTTMEDAALRGSGRG